MDDCLLHSSKIKCNMQSTTNVRRILNLCRSARNFPSSLGVIQITEDASVNEYRVCLCACANCELQSCHQPQERCTWRRICIKPSLLTSARVIVIDARCSITACLHPLNAGCLHRYTSANTSRVVISCNSLTSHDYVQLS